jgi:hypothetical protein
MDISHQDVVVAEVQKAVFLSLEDMLKLRHLDVNYSGLAASDIIRAEPKRINQIVTHLVEYASRNAHAGSQIKVEMLRENDDLIVRVAYEGRGIPYHVQAHIFDRFVGRERGGPGLALALVKALVALHDGFITLESEPSSGAAFTVRLPHQTQVSGKARVVSRPKSQKDVA